MQSLEEQLTSVILAFTPAANSLVINSAIFESFFMKAGSPSSVLAAKATKRCDRGFNRQLLAGKLEVKESTYILELRRNDELIN